MKNITACLGNKTVRIALVVGGSLLVVLFLALHALAQPRLASAEVQAGQAVGALGSSLGEEGGPISGIDGAWMALIGRKRLILNLETEGDRLFGTVSKENRPPVSVTDGKFNQQEFAFTTVERRRLGQRTISWSGTVSGDNLKLYRQEGKKRMLLLASRQR